MPDGKPELIIRRFDPEAEDAGALHALIQDAFQTHLERGVRFVVLDDSPEDTRQKARTHETYVAEWGGELVGSITLNLPYQISEGRAFFEQLAVRPGLTTRGIGSRLIEFVESRARELGATDMGLFTPEEPTGLIPYYEKRGYRIAVRHHWPEADYGSVIMVKSLVVPAGA